MKDYLRIEEWVKLNTFSWEYGEDINGGRWFKADKYDRGYQVWEVYITHFDEDKVKAYAESYVKNIYRERLDGCTFQSAIKWTLKTVKGFPQEYPDSYWKELERKEIESKRVVHFPENIQPILRKKDKGIF